MEPKIRTFKDRIRDAIRAFKGSQIGSLTFGVEVKRCDGCEYKMESEPRILYECDLEKCEICNYPDCRYTNDILHAKNFHNEMGIFVEDRQEEEE